MKAVILDGYVLNPGDLSWDGIKQLCDLTIYDRTSNEEIVERIGDCDIVFTNKVPLTEEIINQAPHLKYVGVMATGYNVVDIEACRKRNIPVTNIPEYSTDSVAQLVFALLLEICHHVGEHSNQVLAGKWSNHPDFSFWSYPLIELAGKTFGIIGFGSTGIAVSRIAKAFGMKVIVYSRTIKKDYIDDQLTFVSLEELYAQADIISLHVPLTEETKEMINHESLAKMKDNAILINTARGGVIHEESVYQALESGKLYAAGIDVTTVEPIPSDSPLLKAKNIFITPHIAWAPFESRSRLMEILEDNLQGFIMKSYINVVNGVTP